nr:hypothetical protein [Marinicella sp. W31]MDC2875863.1 hypothetical protein [Marinicella sp. W31]
MRFITIAAALTPVAVGFPFASVGHELSSGAPVFSDADLPLLAVTCQRRDQEESGSTRRCYYECLGKRIEIEVRRSESCPLMIDR